MLISFFQGACATQGIDQEEGRSILKKLHDAGVVMHYEDVEELNRWVYTKPEETMAAFTRVRYVEGRRRV